MQPQAPSPSYSSGHGAQWHTKGSDSLRSKEICLLKPSTVVPRYPQRTGSSSPYPHNSTTVHRCSSPSSKVVRYRQPSLLTDVHPTGTEGRLWFPDLLTLDLPPSPHILSPLIIYLVTTDKSCPGSWGGRCTLRLTWELNIKWNSRADCIRPRIPKELMKFRRENGSVWPLCQIVVGLLVWSLLRSRCLEEHWASPSIG